MYTADALSRAPMREKDIDPQISNLRLNYSLPLLLLICQLAKTDFKYVYQNAQATDQICAFIVSHRMGKKM